MSAAKKNARTDSQFLKKASGPKPPNRAAMKGLQRGGLGNVGRGLGGGLDTLITPTAPVAPPVATPHFTQTASASEISEAERVLQVPPQDIERCPFQPRTEFGREQLDDLVESIRENGVIQPLTCRRRADGKLELICGERRQRAHHENEREHTYRKLDHRLPGAGNRRRITVVNAHEEYLPIRRRVRKCVCTNRN